MSSDLDVDVHSTTPANTSATTAPTAILGAPRAGAPEGDDGVPRPPGSHLPPYLFWHSGVYTAEAPAAGGPVGGHVGVDFPRTRLTREELRVDVDGMFPTMTISGTVTRLLVGRLTWIARVTKDPATGAWSGPISYRDGPAALRPHAHVCVTLTGSQLSVPGRRATATFSDGPVADLIMTYSFSTSAFREVAVECDTVSDATAVTSYDPSTHPNRPAGAPTYPLTLEKAYSRAGITVTTTGGDGVIPLEAGTDGTWSSLELHDAMQAHWSRWKDAPQWAVWVLFAARHDDPDYGGLMFDDIGTAQRQGTAIFSDSFISQPPAGETHPGPWVQRMRFWTAVHEIGHTFDLMHSWLKSIDTGWVPMGDQPSALSYMNYPYYYPQGEDAFFHAFDFTFSPDELLFLRHAPERFVEPGAERWRSQHGVERHDVERLRAGAVGPLALDLRVHRADRRYEYLEPVVVELRLRNTSPTPVVVDADTLTGGSVALMVSRDGGPARRWRPFVTTCRAPRATVLQPGESIYTSVFLSAGAGGWLIHDPGSYQAYAVVDLGAGGVALSPPLRLQVRRPAAAEVSRLGDDVFTQEVARTLAFGGTRQLHRANDVLREVADRLPGSRAAVHAASALGAPLAGPGKVLAFAVDGRREKVAVQDADADRARDLLSTSLADFSAAADSLGHIGVTAQTERLAAVMAVQGDDSARRELLRTSAGALTARGVLPGVVAELHRRADAG